MKRGVFKLMLMFVLLVPCVMLFSACGKSDKFQIVISSSIVNGKVTSDKSSAKKGETVTLTFKGDSERFVVESVLVNGGDVEVSGTGNTRTFVMPEKDVEIKAIFGVAYKLSKTPLNGKILINDQTDNDTKPVYCLPGQVVSIEVVPDVEVEGISNYLVSDIVVGSVYDGIEVSKVTDSKYTFVMPEKDVFISARMFNVLDEEDIEDYTVEQDGTITIHKISGSCFGVIIPNSVEIEGVSYVISGFEAKGEKLENRTVFNDDVVKVVFHNTTGLKKIGCRTFNECLQLSSIEIPDSVVEIGVDAFSNCTALKNIQIGKNVQLIDVSNFIGLNNLKTIVISNENNYYGVGISNKIYGLFEKDAETGQLKGVVLKELQIQQ